MALFLAKDDVWINLRSAAGRQPRGDERGKTHEERHHEEPDRVHQLFEPEGRKHRADTEAKDRSERDAKPRRLVT